MALKHREEILAVEPYVPGKPIEEVQRKYGLKDIIKLASNENPLGPSPKAKRALRRLINTAHIYPDGSCSALRQQLAILLDVAENQIIFGNGSDEVLKFIAEAFLCPGDEVIMADPTFSEYQFVTRMMGASEILVPVKGFRHDLTAMAREITDRTKLIFICNPNNPTGTIVTQDELDSFLRDVPNHVLVVIDEAYYEYVTSNEYPSTLPLMHKDGNVLITRTFSKIHGLAALRIGYGLAKYEIIHLLERVREPFNVSALAQGAAQASLTDLDHVRKSYVINNQGKAYLYRELNQLGISFIPTEANFILLDLAQDGVSIFQELLKRGVIVRSAHVFGLPTYIRVTIGTSDQNICFIQALKEVLAGENCN